MKTYDIFDLFKKETQAAITTEVSLTRQWHFKAGHKSTIEKTWNQGMGLLELISINPRVNVILINTALWSKADQRHWDNVLEKSPELSKYTTIKVWFGYPLYYNYCFSPQTFAGLPDYVDKDDYPVLKQIMQKYIQSCQTI